MNIPMPLTNGKPVFRCPTPRACRTAKKPPKVKRRRVVPVSVLRNRTHPARSMTDAAYRREVERCVEVEAEKLRQAAVDLPDGDPRYGQWCRATKATIKKAWSYQSCGQIVAARVCGCGTPRAGTATAPPGEVMYHCHMDCCGHCGRRRANILSKTLQDKLAVIPLSDGCYLMSITFTERSAPADPAEYTVQRIDERVEALRAGIRAAWNPELHLGEKMQGRLKLGEKLTSTCMFSRVEISDNGTIHAHAVYYGPWRIKEQLEAILLRAWSAAGFVDLQIIASTQEMKAYQASCLSPDETLTVVQRKVNSKIREATKYTVKGPSPLDEDHLAGAQRWRLDPALAAKWELATYGQRMTEWYGTLRGAAKAEAAAEAAVDAETLMAQQLVEQDDDVVCDCCGMVGEWRWQLMPIREYVRSCHDRRLKAFPRSRWCPPSPQRE